MTNSPDEIWAVYYEDFSAQTSEVYAQDTPDGFVDKPTKYIRADLVAAAVAKERRSKQ